MAFREVNLLEVVVYVEMGIKKDNILKNDTKKPIHIGHLIFLPQQNQGMENYYLTQNLPNTTITFKMAPILSGRFLMGNQVGNVTAQSPAEKKWVWVDTFCMAENLVTQELWEAVTRSNPSFFVGKWKPVTNVNWFDTVIFCNMLSASLGKDPVYYSPNGIPFGLENNNFILGKIGSVFIDYDKIGYRLPTEAEWEWAACGIDNYRYSGSDLLGQVGWYNKNSNEETRDIGLLLPNAQGLYDMSGNVWEWCADWYGAYVKTEQGNPRGPENGLERIIRGGSWNQHSEFCEPVYRKGISPDTQDSDLGFRFVIQNV